MDNIEDVYSNQVYYPFLLYCEKRNYKTMQDLMKCAFDELMVFPGITPSLLMRIKSVYAAYCKKHPDMLMMQKASKPRSRTEKAGPPPGLEDRLKTYFEAHADSLIRLTDLTKALGAKRNDILTLLEHAPWSKAVDAATFFYTPVE